MIHIYRFIIYNTHICLRSTCLLLSNEELIAYNYDSYNTRICWYLYHSWALYASVVYTISPIACVHADTVSPIACVHANFLVLVHLWDNKVVVLNNLRNHGHSFHVFLHETCNEYVCEIAHDTTLWNTRETDCMPSLS